MTTGMPTHRPADLQELMQIVRDAQASHAPLQVVGGGSKLGIGFPQRETYVVSTASFDQIIDYDPAELVLTVGSGVRLAAIESLLAQHRQMLAFEPFDFAAINDGVTGATTIGGIVAAGIAGSRRLSAGNVRDHVLGFTGVSGRGES
jgi:glycolate oxidase FAD binding subunit